MPRQTAVVKAAKAATSCLPRRKRVGVCCSACAGPAAPGGAAPCSRSTGLLTRGHLATDRLLQGYARTTFDEGLHDQHPATPAARHQAQLLAGLAMQVAVFQRVQHLGDLSMSAHPYPVHALI